MNQFTRKLLENVQGLKDPQGFLFDETGDWISVLAPNPFPEGNGARLDMSCSDDGSLIIVQGPRFDARGFASPEDLRALLRVQSRFRLLRFISTQVGPMVTPRLELYLPTRELPPKEDPAYRTILDLSLAVLVPTMAYLRIRVRDGIWDESLIQEDPPALQAITAEIRNLEDQLQTHRERADLLRQAIVPKSKVLPNFI